MKPEHEELCAVRPGKETWAIITEMKIAIRELSAEIDLANEGEALSRKHGFVWKERAELAEAELAKVKGHAEAMADRIEWYAEEGWVNGDIPEATAYRRDYPGSEE